MLSLVTVQLTVLVRFHGSDIVLQIPGIRTEAFHFSIQILQGVQIPGIFAFCISGDHFHPDTLAVMGLTDGLQFFPDALVEVVQLIPDDCFPGQGDHIIGRQAFRGSQELNAVKVNTVVPFGVLDHVDDYPFIPRIFACVRLHLNRAVICLFPIRDFYVINPVAQGLPFQQLINLPLCLFPADSLVMYERVRQFVRIALRPSAEEFPDGIFLVVVQGLRIGADVLNFLRPCRDGIFRCGFRRFSLLLCLLFCLHLHVRTDRAQRELYIPETIFPFLGVCCLNRQLQLFRLFRFVIQHILLV